MNKRNQNQRTLIPASPPVVAPAAAYLNVFTVEEYESNGKTQKKWTRIGAAFPHKEGPGFPSSSRRSRSMDDWSSCLPIRKAVTNELNFLISGPARVPLLLCSSHLLL